jgi:hydrogenase maturation protein HypF
MMKTVLIKVKGIVQGVGFRPFIHRLAMKYGINGSVRNASGSVFIEASGKPASIKAFIKAISREKPRVSRIHSIEIKNKKTAVYNRFRVIKSISSDDVRLVPPDIKTCDKCLAEFSDPENRRFHYPFINCTDCGPRFTIIKNTPYDRQNTTMSGFKMCQACLREYRDINNRRYHAEPDACSICGPKVRLADSKGNIIERDNEKVFAKARILLKKGKILAIKGLGGFHIAVDASNHAAVLKLKKRKHRSNKPFAVMADSEETVRKHVFTDSYSEALLKRPEAPVVILKNKKNSGVAANAGPDLKHTGFFLPYTSLHSLLFEKGLETLIMTSANIAEEPIQYENKTALSALADIADYFLLHDRAINIPADDSVIKPFEKNRAVILRRSRGYVPVSLAVKTKTAEIVGTGALLKNSLCVIKAGQAFMSQHIGDLENRKAYDYFTVTLDNFLRFYDVKPSAIACDLHPDYLSTGYAEEFSKKRHIPLIRVQHHYSHMLSVMAEHGFYKKVIGIIMDGTGYGSDGKTWGGEFLVGDLNGFIRAGHLKYLSLPGADLASKQAFRTAISVLNGFLPPGEICRFYRDFDASGILNAQNRRINISSSSGAGRLFDAASSILGICQESTYDAEAAMKLEAAATDVRPAVCYDYALKDVDGMYVPDFEPVFQQLWRNRTDKKAPANFHLTFASALCETASRISKDTGLNDIVLAGGVFQNTVLLKMLLKKLQKKGFNVLINEKLAPNDSSIALGQAVYAAKKLHF